MTVKLSTPWTLHGIDDLEPAAWEALRYNGNACVLAGPGAGKTEYLAQRASYLLEAGVCPKPRRILSISFKRDAAANLERRVGSRTPEHADRFVSMIFDAFTKSVVDRFRDLLPEYWKLNGSYTIRYAKNTEVRDFLNALSESAEGALQTDLYRIHRNSFIASAVGSYDLPGRFEEPTHAREYAIQQWWQYTYLSQQDPGIDFVAINRLAELVIRSSPALRTALRWTYPFVFIDEFQDTTFAQYSFLRSVFGNDPLCQVTVVGDNKQRIMGWAGALSDAFAEFSNDFDTKRFDLLWNFRSSPALVQFQHRVAKMLDPASPLAISKTTSDIDDEPVKLWSFPNQRRETEVIAAWIATDIAESGRPPSQYALVARQTVAEFQEDLTKAFAAHDLQVRNDDAAVGELKLQVLLKDRLGALMFGLLKLAAPRSDRAGQPEVWREVSSTIARLRTGDAADHAETAVDNELSTLLRTLRAWLNGNECESNVIHTLLDKLVDVLDQITDGNYTTISDRPEDAAITKDAMAQRFIDVITPGCSWRDAIEAYDAPTAVPLMTIHRSKGFEYHTVFFLGLEDGQWWSHLQDVDASTSTFFVGLSRAAQRIIFTQCNTRGETDGIASFYELLDEAGIVTESFT